MAEKLLMVFIGKAFLYLFLYFLFLFFLTNIVGISPYTIQPFGKGGAIGALILAGVHSWDTVFKKKEQEQEQEQENDKKTD